MSVRVAGDKALPPEVVEQIVAKTDGVPLFVEELTKTVLESGLLREGEERYELTGPLPPLAIPTTLHDSLMARLDRLATVKDVAQLGATIGRTFAYELLQGSLLDDATLQHSLWQLVEAELVYQRGRRRRRPTRSSMRSSRTRRINRCCGAPAAVSPAHCAGGGRAVSRDGRDATGTAGAALHRSRAQRLAVVYWQRAGKRASERSAYVEAISHLRKGLAVLQMLPGHAARLQHELELQTTLGPA